MNRNLSRREMLRRAAVAGALGAVRKPCRPDGAGALQEISAGPKRARSRRSSRDSSRATRRTPARSKPARALHRPRARPRHWWRRAHVRGPARRARRLRAQQRRQAVSQTSTRAAKTPCSRPREERGDRFAPSASAFFELVLGHTLEGTFSGPLYGGNRDFIGWQLIGYRACASPCSRTSSAWTPRTRCCASPRRLADVRQERRARGRPPWPCRLP